MKKNWRRKKCNYEQNTKIQKFAYKKITQMNQTERWNINEWDKTVCGRTHCPDMAVSGSNILNNLKYLSKNIKILWKTLIQLNLKNICFIGYIIKTFDLKFMSHHISFCIYGLEQALWKIKSNWILKIETQHHILNIWS